MNIFKPGSMMQEHRPHQASQRESRGQLDEPANFFLNFTLIWLHQTLM
jgi:hypothetical protein